MIALKRAAIKRPKVTDVEDHWAKLIEGMHFSSREFYDRVEAALVARQIPQLATERVGWKEGGPLSPSREYLRLRRERLTFDICAMPFGSGFFVAEWIGEQRHRLGAMLVLVAIAFMATIATWISDFQNTAYSATNNVFGIPRHDVLLAFWCLPLLFGAWATVWYGTYLDDVLIQTPVVGYIYERYFRRLTYYRIDQTCAYRAAVHAAVCEVIDEISESQGIAPLSEFERRPLHQGLHTGIQGRQKPRAAPLGQ